MEEEGHVFTWDKAVEAEIQDSLDRSVCFYCKGRRDSPMNLKGNHGFTLGHLPIDGKGYWRKQAFTCNQDDCIKKAFADERFCLPNAF
jgi:hypothetical protein